MTNLTRFKELLEKCTQGEREVIPITGGYMSFAKEHGEEMDYQPALAVSMAIEIYDGNKNRLLGEEEANADLGVLLHNAAGEILALIEAVDDFSENPISTLIGREARIDLKTMRLANDNLKKKLEDDNE